MDMDRKLGGEDLGEEERETIIGIYDLRKRRVFFNKKKSVKLLSNLKETVFLFI